MAQNVCGVSLDKLHDSIAEGMQGHSAVTGGEFRFDCSDELVLTPNRPNSARMRIPILLEGNPVAEAVAIVFAPGDGTGDTNARPLEGLDTGPYPHADLVVPRPKTGIDHEAYLPLATVDLDSISQQAIPFAGSLHMLGEVAGPKGERALTRLATLGLNAVDFARAMNGLFQPEPLATLTTGYESGLTVSPRVRVGRFGDPHAVFNPYDSRLGDKPDRLQVCAFLPITDKQASLRARYVLRALGATMPHFEEGDA